MKQTMKRITAVLVAVCLCMLSVVSVFAQQDGPDVKAEAYCVMNRKDGSIVYSKIWMTVTTRQVSRKL